MMDSVGLLLCTLDKVAQEGNANVVCVIADGRGNKIESTVIGDPHIIGSAMAMAMIEDQRLMSVNGLSIVGVSALLTAAQHKIIDNETDCRDEVSTVDEDPSDYHIYRSEEYDKQLRKERAKRRRTSATLPTQEGGAQREPDAED